MKTYLTIEYVIDREIQKYSTIRARWKRKPTWVGASRMVSKHIQEKYNCYVRPSNITITNIQEACYS